MQFDTIFFDLDDTLYSPDSGIWEAIGERMVEYMVRKVGIPAESAAAERERLFHVHGTTMRGLVAEYQVDDVDFLEFVHDIPIQNYLQKNPILDQILERYPQRKIIFTNADTGHAKRVVNALGIDQHFKHIIDIRSIKPWCKPMTQAFEIALKISDISDPTRCVMVDDAYRNLVTAHKFGLHTIQVGPRPSIDPVANSIRSLEDLPTVLPF